MVYYIHLHYSPHVWFFSISKQTANIFVTVQFAGPRNSCDNIVQNKNMVAVRIIHSDLNFVSKTEKD
jgi:hypothetical protein